MDNITKGDPIKADWANALTNAVNAAAHGKTALRGGGGQNVFISPYQRGSRPLAFDLVEITDEVAFPARSPGVCCCPHTKRNRKKKYR